jgi:hypothetical protein
MCKYNECCTLMGQCIEILCRTKSLTRLSIITLLKEYGYLYDPEFNTMSLVDQLYYALQPCWPISCCDSTSSCFRHLIEHGCCDINC